ncbi:alpha/beta fold hydrolase [Butyrivibrio sp. MC2021]|uniref:alpha/beta fold hydrolase n=1 Tax=Butyrivibrio sp. MC2021 TaxID=1408306 RepID=UPI00068648AF|nr:alpha/beta hydrolase [Butyrivibrio sp. MC2021]
MQNIRFLGEEDFLSAMEKENKPWRKDHVVRGQLKGADNIDFNYYIVSPDGPPKASITFVHGLGEFFGKYHEYFMYLALAGYKVFFLEQRGHGYSGGKTKDVDTIYIDSYMTYVRDLKLFVDKVVVPESKGLDMLLLAHSMGGAIATLFLETYDGYFKAAILSSPMFRMMAGNLNPIMRVLLKAYAVLFGQMQKLAPNQKHFDPNTDFTKSSALSRPRFDYQLALRKRDQHYQTTGATFGWALASMKVHGDIMRNARKLKLPITVMTAGQDHLIDPAGYEEFKGLVPSAVFHPYPDSRHEIFNALEPTRKAYYKDVLTTLDGYLNH